MLLRTSCAGAMGSTLEQGISGTLAKGQAGDST